MRSIYFIALPPPKVPSSCRLRTSTWRSRWSGWARGRRPQRKCSKALHLGQSSDEVGAVVGSLLHDYAPPQSPLLLEDPDIPILRVANRLFGDASCSFEAPFLERMLRAFGAPLQSANFKGEAEKARNDINDWVAKQTEQRVLDLLPSGSIDSEVRLVLASAIYLHANWSQPFSRASTTRLPFHTSSSTAKPVPMMHQTARFDFVARDGLKILELPYRGSNLTMSIVLPDRVDGLDEVEHKFSQAAMDRGLAALKATRVDVALPRMKISATDSVKLSGVLKALGVHLVFDSSRADLTGIASPASSCGRLYLREVFHKAFINVDEKGTEAAAATGAVAGVLFGRHRRAGSLQRRSPLSLPLAGPRHRAHSLHGSHYRSRRCPMMR